jgi:hypothetical protein
MISASKKILNCLNFAASPAGPHLSRGRKYAMGDSNMAPKTAVFLRKRRLVTMAIPFAHNCPALGLFGQYCNQRA